MSNHDDHPDQTDPHQERASLSRAPSADDELLPVRAFGPAQGAIAPGEAHSSNDHPPAEVAESVVAKVAAHYAALVPGVIELRPTLGRAVGSFAGRVVTRSDSATGDLPTAGVRVKLTGPQTAEIHVDMVIAFGYACPEVAADLQRTVAERVATLTGTDATISVSIVDVEAAPLQPTGS